MITSWYTKLKKLLAQWLLPPKLKAFILFIVLFRERKYKKYKKLWLHTPIDTGLHSLPFFSSLHNKPYWISLNKEVRPTVRLKNSINLLIQNKIYQSKFIQLGVGFDNIQGVSKVTFTINGKHAGSISDIICDEWHDFRFALDRFKDTTEIKINFEGNGSLLLSHPTIYSKVTRKNNSKPHNIICIILDGLNPWLFSDQNTPSTNMFFSNGVICSQTYSQGDWTLPAFSSMLTGCYPSRHGVTNPGEYDSALPGNLLTLPEILLKSGYHTLGCSNHLRFNPAYGHAKGFERFIYPRRHKKDYYIQTINKAIQHLEAHKLESNFLFLHFFDTHPPFGPSGYLKNSLLSNERFCNCYYHGCKEGFDNFSFFIKDERIAKLKEVDLALSTFYSYMQSQAWFSDATIILTTDHGITEKVKNKPLLLQDRVRIPLMVNDPSLSKRKCDSYIEGSVDLMPSILSLAEIHSPSDIDGQKWPFLGGEKRSKVFSESMFVDTYEAAIRDQKNCYHFKCPFNQQTREIFYKEKDQIVAYRRSDGRDIEKDIDISSQDEGQILSQFYKYISS